MVNENTSIWAFQFALVLAIGTVVDNAIVVVEAVQARFDVGYRSSYMATNDALKGISSAILTSTLIFMAVFIPVSMMGGTSGAFYSQFGITMAVAVGISAVNTFTLAPALCALLLKPYIDEQGQQKNNFAARFRRAFNAVFDAVTARYVRGVVLFIKRRWLMWGTLVAGFVLLAVLVRSTKTGLVPDEDTGMVFISMNAKPGTSMQQNERVMEQINEHLKEIPGIAYNANLTGYSFFGAGPSMGMYFLSLKHWDERKEPGQSATDILNRVYAFAPEIPDAHMFVMKPPMIPGYGMGSGFELYVQEEATLLFRQSLLDAGKEVNDALTAWQTARQRVAIDGSQVAALREAVRKTELLMRHSPTTYLEVLTAQQSLLTVELAEAQDRFDEIQGVIDLYHALGGGL